MIAPGHAQFDAAVQAAERRGLTGGRATTFIRFGRTLEAQPPRPVPYPVPKFIRMAETFTHISGRTKSPSQRHGVIVSRSVAPINLARVEWLERGNAE